MIKVENVKVYNIARAVYSARNAMNSWDKSDSDLGKDILGENDLGLAKRLCVAGSEHRKYLRQIFVVMDITSNHFFTPELDTYKVGTVRNSCSKMHKIHVKEFLPMDFSHEGIDEVGGCTKDVFKEVLDELERLRISFNETKEKKYWRAMLELLPMGYNIKFTLSMNYENVINIIKQRRGHKLLEWRELCNILLDLPYVEELVNSIDKREKEEVKILKDKCTELEKTLNHIKSIIQSNDTYGCKINEGNLNILDIIMETIGNDNKYYF